MTKRLTAIFITLSMFMFLVPMHTSAYECIKTSTGMSSDELTGIMKACEDASAAAGQQIDTLNAAIKVLDVKIKLAQAQINQTQVQINSLANDITVLSGVLQTVNQSMDQLGQIYVARVRESYKRSREDSFDLIFTKDIGDFMQKLTYLNTIKARDQLILTELEKSRQNYDEKKQSKEDKQQQMEALQSKLVAQKHVLDVQQKEKQNLLKETQNSEAKYQQLRAAAAAQLAALSQFAESVGIQLISHKDISDDWGKYYNQRDENWGDVLINSQSSGCGGACTVAKVGCLITSYSMVVTHYGGSVTPDQVATNPEDFWVNTAQFNQPGPSANGHSASFISNPSTQQLKDALNSGKSVIAGLSANGGPYPSHYADHWVVLRSVDGDSFKINDPLYEGALNVPLNDHYSGWAIIEARIYN